MSKLLEGFASYQPADLPPDKCTVGTPLGTRLQRIVRLPHGWRLWLATRDFIHGSYLELHDSGGITHTTVREDEGDEEYMVRPTDYTIRLGNNL